MLGLAARGRMVEVVDLLLDKKVDVKRSRKNAKTALRRHSYLPRGRVTSTVRRRFCRPVRTLTPKTRMKA